MRERSGMTVPTSGTVAFCDMSAPGIVAGCVTPAHHGRIGSQVAYIVNVAAYFVKGVAQMAVQSALQELAEAGGDELGRLLMRAARAVNEEVIERLTSL